MAYFLTELGSFISKRLSTYLGGVRFATEEELERGNALQKVKEIVCEVPTNYSEIRFIDTVSYAKRAGENGIRWLFEGSCDDWLAKIATIGFRMRAQMRMLEEYVKTEGADFSKYELIAMIRGGLKVSNCDIHKISATFIPDVQDESERRVLRMVQLDYPCSPIVEEDRKSVV